MFTAAGWAAAEDALRTAEALAHDDDERGGAACERGHLAYAATVLGVRDRADEARSALGRAAALLAPTAPGRPLLDFRRGLMAEHVADSPDAARAAYRRAHAGATAHGDILLLSFTWRHLAGLALRDGELAEARHGFAESLRIREELGFLIGTAPALAALADAVPDTDAPRLRAEAARLFRLMGGVPTWLADHLSTGARLPRPGPGIRIRRPTTPTTEDGWPSPVRDRLPLRPPTVNPPSSAMPARAAIGRIRTVPAVDRPGRDG